MPNYKALKLLITLLVFTTKLLDFLLDKLVQYDHIRFEKLFLILLKISVFPLDPCQRINYALKMHLPFAGFALHKQLVDWGAARDLLFFLWVFRSLFVLLSYFCNGCLLSSIPRLLHCIFHSICQGVPLWAYRLNYAVSLKRSLNCSSLLG